MLKNHAQEFTIISHKLWWRQSCLQMHAMLMKGHRTKENRTKESCVCNVMQTMCLLIRLRCLFAITQRKVDLGALKNFAVTSISVLVIVQTCEKS